MAGERILIVEDEAVQRTLVSRQLERRGYRVKTANDGLLALQAIGEETPHLVITDINMPYVNGFELARRMRASHKTARIPIIMLSIRDEAADMLAGYAEGADDYVPKPVDMAILVAKVETLLRRAWAPAVAAQDAGIGAVVLFLRAKGGVGATTLAANAAISLARGQVYPTVLLDLNLLFGNIDVLLDVEPSSTLADLARVTVADLDERTFNQFLVRHDSGVRLLAAPALPEEAESVSVTTVQQTIDRLRLSAEFVVVDMPLSFTEVSLAAIDAADVVCLVTTPQLPALRATAGCLVLLKKLQIASQQILLVLNRMVPTGLDNSQVTRFLQRAPDILIPYTAYFDEAANSGKPLVLLQPTSAATTEIRDLASRITSTAAAGVRRTSDETATS